ncbi:hypothetical protein GCK32_003493, partial [Trichostrongylus colubriformis]
SMQVASVNDVKIYNLSAGKSIPEWMNSEARRRAERKSIDVRRRIQLIQDFEMPDVSHTVNISRDGRYVFATGSYKSWLKCYDLENLSLKFQRGLDAAVIKMIPLSDDYSKIVLLQEDRFLEMHAAFGRYFRMRMPRYGRDMAFSFERSDLFLVGASSEVYRLNLELGEWLSPLQTSGSALNCCQFADAHQLFVCGTTDGQVEAWDHRDKSRVGILDCLPYLQDEISKNPEITSLMFRDALRLGVGTSTGQVMLYDIRSRKPLIVKDHVNGLPIKKIDFALRESESLVLSMDSRVLKIWNEVEGKPFAAIETEHALNDFCRYPHSGLIFMANEAPRMQQFFIPSIGTAPKWCSYLEALTEELEETQSATGMFAAPWKMVSGFGVQFSALISHSHHHKDGARVTFAMSHWFLLHHILTFLCDCLSFVLVYDDYKFVTKEELDQLSLSHLIGSSVLRAYMHGYFLDRRLYEKAQLITQPFAYEKYKNRKVQDIMQQERENRVIVSKTESNQPKVSSSDFKSCASSLSLDENPVLMYLSSKNPEITSLMFRDALRLGVGTSTGQVMLYDIRSRKPLIVKDHVNGLPIKKIDFALRESESLVLSMDSRVLKIWNEVEGKPFAAIETEHALNDFCRYPHSGLIFMANEAPRMQQFFIPSIGTAPKWCSYLEALTEELEETQSATGMFAVPWKMISGFGVRFSALISHRHHHKDGARVTFAMSHWFLLHHILTFLCDCLSFVLVYDDYKFVTKEELDQLSLSHLIGSSVLRAYMHGYFLDRRLYEKAQLITQPFAYEKYKNRKVQDIMQQERENRVIVSKTESNQPKVNKELAARLRAEAEMAGESAANKSAKKKKNEKKKASVAAVILQDDRFKKLFDDEDFEVDQNCELFKRNVAIQQKETAGKVREILQDDDENEDEEIIEQSELPDIDDMNEGTSQRNRSAASSSDSDDETDEETLPEKKRREREKARRKQERLERQKQLYEEKKLKEEMERTARLINKPKKFVLHELDSTEGAQRFLDEHVKETADEEEATSLASKKSLMQEQGDFEKHEDVFGGRSITFNLKKRGASAREAKAIEEKKKHKKERRETVRTPTLNIKRSLKRLPGNLSRP